MTIQFSNSQQIAINRLSGPTLTVAGAGAGKTAVLTQRIWNLMMEADVPQEQILAITFTNKSAKEMRQRIAKMYASAIDSSWEIRSDGEREAAIYEIEAEHLKDLWIGTFHSVIVKILRSDYGIWRYKSPEGLTWKTGFSIFDDKISTKLLKDTIKALDIDTEKFELARVKKAISNAKSQGLSASQYTDAAENFDRSTIGKIYLAYQTALSENNALDFNDILLIGARLLADNGDVRNFWSSRFHHLSVDEYQDSNYCQNSLLESLSTQANTPEAWQDRSLFLVGDADQLIYSWRGADLGIILEFEQKYGAENIIKLEENYRSQGSIIDAANNLIEMNEERYKKVLIPTREGAGSVSIKQLSNEFEEAAWIAQTIAELGVSPDKVAVLYRTNAQCNPIEVALLERGIPHQVVSGFRFFDREVIKDLVAYLRFMGNTDNTIDLNRIANIPKRRNSPAVMKRVADAAKLQNRTAWDLIKDEIALAGVGKGMSNLYDFGQMMDRYIQQLPEIRVSDLLQQLVAEIGYEAYLSEDDEEEAQKNIGYVYELVEAARRFEVEHPDSILNDFLELASLSSSADERDKGGVSLLTIHAAKGLEYPVVFLAGCEDGFMPSRDLSEDEPISEEERRLAYVAITRSEDSLYISHAKERRIYGSKEQRKPSPFLAEIV